jgi:hypothetical protein
MKTARIEGWSPVRNGVAVTTAKAVRITVEYVDGEGVNADTTWLPRSIATDLQVERIVDNNGLAFRVTAVVPMWWIRRLDTRAGWEKAGMSRPPMAQRPW